MPFWWRAADEDYLAGKCIACCYVPSIVLAIDRCAGPCARARGEAGTTAADPVRRSCCVIATAADPARRSYCRSLSSRIIATAAAATPRAYRTITRIRRTRAHCAGQGGESDKRLIKGSAPNSSTVQGGGKRRIIKSALRGPTGVDCAEGNRGVSP